MKNTNVSNIEFMITQARLGTTCFWRIEVINSSNEDHIALGSYLAKVPRSLAFSRVGGKDYYKSISAILYKTQLEIEDLFFGLNQEVPITEDLLASVELPICNSSVGKYRPSTEVLSFQYIDLDFCERIE